MALSGLEARERVMTIIQIEQAVTLALGLAALAGVIVGWIKWVRPKVRKAHEESVAIRDAILGRDAIRDSITGKEMVPALPGIGMRMATVEQALITLADNQKRLLELEEAHNDHDTRITALEQGALERTVARVESLQAYKVMEAAIKADSQASSDGDLPLQPSDSQ